MIAIQSQTCILLLLLLAQMGTSFHTGISNHRSIMQRGIKTFIPSNLYSIEGTKLFAGFGSSASGSAKGGKGKGKGKGKKGGKSVLTPLKPKKQWDYYSSDILKNTPRTDVGVRIYDESVSETDTATETETEMNPWLKVGFVKSKDGEYTKYALLRQRALVAEHAKRLYPLKFRSNPRVEWGYIVSSAGSSDKEELEEGEVGEDVWEAVSPKEYDSLDVPSGEEKSIGFEGFCDTATGFYCQYHEGKLVGESISASTSKYV